MNPKDFVYNQAFKGFINLGYPERDAVEVAVEAVRLWARQSKGSKAIEEAIKNGKKRCGAAKK